LGNGRPREEWGWGLVPFTPPFALCPVFLIYAAGVVLRALPDLRACVSWCWCAWETGPPGSLGGAFRPVHHVIRRLLVVTGARCPLTKPVVTATAVELQVTTEPHCSRGVQPGFICVYVVQREPTADSRRSGVGLPMPATALILYRVRV
jgi:hypothetical protein